MPKRIVVPVTEQKVATEGTAADILRVVEGDVSMTLDVTELRQTILVLKIAIDRSYFELAGLLHRAYTMGAYSDWGYRTWKEYVEGELEMSDRKAQYLMSIWEWFVKVLKDPEVRAKVEPLGWSKVKSLVGIVTPENVDEWVETATRLSKSELEEQIRGVKAGKDPDQIEKPTTVTFQLFPKQLENVEDAMELAGKVAVSEKRGHLLDLICTAYRADQVFQMAPGVTMVQAMFLRLGNVLGIHLIGIDASTDEVIFGREHVAKLQNG